MSPFQPLLALVVGSSILVACAPTVQESWTTPSGQRCSSAEEATTSADLAVLLNHSESASADLAPFDTLLFNVWYDSTGALSGVRAFGRPGRQVDSSTVATALRQRFVPRADADVHSYGLYVRDAEPQMRAHSVQIECAPHLLNGDEIRQHLLNLSSSPEGRKRGILAWLFVDADGTVARVTVDASSGDPRADDELLRIGWRARFAPALMDGFVVPVWVALPLGIDAAPPRRPDGCPPPEVQPSPCTS